MTQQRPWEVLRIGFWKLPGSFGEPLAWAASSPTRSTTNCTSLSAAGSRRPLAAHELKDQGSSSRLLPDAMGTARQQQDGDLRRLSSLQSKFGSMTRTPFTATDALRLGA